MNLSRPWSSGGRLWEKLASRAREMRRAPTKAENLLWWQLRNRGLAGYRFRRQHAVGPYIVDFYCSERKAIVEVDGAIHEFSAEEDRARDAYLSSCGLRVLRAHNSEVEQSLDELLVRIRSFLEMESSPSP